MRFYKKHTMKEMLRSISLTVGLLTIGLMLGQAVFAQAQTKIIDKIIAQIGDEIILLSDLQNMRLQAIQAGQDDSGISDCEILEEQLYEKLLINQAELDSIEVQDDMVNQEMEARLREIAKQIGSIEKLEEFYGKSVAQIKAEFFDIIKKRMMAEQMSNEITSTVNITPKEIKDFFNNYDKDSIPYINSKISLAQIVIYPEITLADKKAAKDKLEGIRDKIIKAKENGEDVFGSMAAIHSDDPGSKLQDGKLGWQTKGNMVPEFEAALFVLERGGVSPVFETQYGYHIVQLLDRKGNNYESRHVLITSKVSDAALMKAIGIMDSLHKQLKKGTITFDDGALHFSDDENSKMNGGKIVNPYTGDYFWDMQNINEIDPQMSRIVDRLEKGKFSEPSLYENLFEQKQGIRLVKLLDRTKPHLANLKDDRQLIELAALNEKKQAEIDDWIQRRINRSFVRIESTYRKACKFKYNWIKIDETVKK